MKKYYVSTDIEIETGICIPRREFDLIEFYKKIIKDNTIVTIEFNVEGHMVVFHVLKKEN